MTLPRTPAWEILTVAVATGVFVDLDHFVIARSRDGDWRAFRRLLANPTAPFGADQRLFADSDLDGLDRLVSHVLITGVVVPVLFVLSPALALVAAVSLYAHVLADVYATWKNSVVFDADDVPEALRDR